jgi:hypothetical protein
LLLAQLLDVKETGIAATVVLAAAVLEPTTGTETETSAVATAVLAPAPTPTAIASELVGLVEPYPSLVISETSCCETNIGLIDLASSVSSLSSLSLSICAAAAPLAAPADVARFSPLFLISTGKYFS